MTLPAPDLAAMRALLACPQIQGPFTEGHQIDIPLTEPYIPLAWACDVVSAELARYAPLLAAVDEVLHLAARAGDGSGSWPVFYFKVEEDEIDALRAARALTLPATNEDGGAK